MGYYMTQMEMPNLDVGELPKDWKHHVSKAIAEFDEDQKYWGEEIVEERYHGTVPIGLHSSPNPAGVTYLEREGKDVVAKKISLSDKIGSAQGIKRVTKHELRHVKAERLLKYADVPGKVAELIHESYTEYGGIKDAERRRRYGEAEEIRKTTPYKWAIQWGEMVDKTYVSDRDGKSGYRTFIRDIFLNKSMSETLHTLERCKRKVLN